MNYVQRPGKPVFRHGQRIETIELVPSSLIRQKTEALEDRLIGCPVWWLQCIRPILDTADTLIVGIYVWRRWVVCGKRATFDVPNGELQALGISRKIKYRVLDLLAAAGLIRIVRHSTKAALEVTILAEKPRRK